jgi:phage terminase Nu1 subunit (DNA packaging protein)
MSLTGISTLLNRDRNTISKYAAQSDFPFVQKADKATGVPWIFDISEVVRWLETKASSVSAKKIVSEFSETGTVDIDEAKRRKSVAEAILAELSVDQHLSSVVLIEDVMSEISDEYSALRTALSSLPGKISTSLVGRQNDNEIERIISSAINEALDTLKYDAS